MRGRTAATIGWPMPSTDAPVHRLSYEDVMRMVEAGVLRDEDRLELIDGVLVDVTPPSAAHSAIVAWLTRHFAGAVGEREVRIQDLLLVEGGFLMPDLMVVDPLPRDRHPATALLVVEVAATTQRHDRWKAGRCAGASVAEYWMVDTAARAVIGHRSPGPNGYEQLAVHGDGDRVETPVGAPPVDVSELLGPAG
jgi:Uma2 family endonuclease